jgi:hypothetical protein
MFVLIALSRSTWWDFKMEEFEDKRRNSLNKPIFAICYSRWCPHCHGLAEGTPAYAAGEGNRSDVYITMIDCVDHGHECALFHAWGTPHMVLVMGTNWKYWPRVRSKQASEWTIFLDKFLKPSLREVKTNEELLAAVREPSGGGTTFHLETPTTDNQIMGELHNLSKEYHLFNDTFTYRLNKRLTAPVLTAFTSLYCSARWTNGTLRAFLDQYKFGSRHDFDISEYKLYSRHSKMAVLVVEDGLIGGQNYALEKIPRQFCDEVRFGWIPIKDSKPVLDEFGLASNDLPTLAYSDQDNNKDKCRAFFSGRTIEADRSFLPDAVQGKICGEKVRGKAVNEFYTGGLVSDLAPNLELNLSSGGISYVTIEKKPKGKLIGGNQFCVIYFCLVLVVLMGIRIVSPDDIGKQE